MGPTVQLDDFPYVHIMRRVDDELAKLGRPRLFFHAPDKSFQDGRDWGTLIELLNEDHVDLVEKRRHAPPSAARHLLERIDNAAMAVGMKARLRALDEPAQAAIAAGIEAEATKMLSEKIAGYPDSLDGKTLVVEFARGGKQGASMPLAEPFGYRYSLSRLNDALLEHAGILYVWVTPEESRRKNLARTDPNDPGSILHHGVPMDVMLNDYGCDDLDWLEQTSTVAGTVTVNTRGKTFHVPVARFDNRVDKTSFIREDRSKWSTDEIRAVHDGLKGALSQLAARAR